MNFSFFLASYANVIYEFLFELYVFVALFTFRLNRKRFFLLRLFVGLAAMLVIGYGAMVAYHFIGSTVWGRVLIYFVLFLCVLVHGRICFAESMWVMLFSCDMAYAAQNLFYKVYLSLSDILNFYIKSVIIRFSCFALQPYISFSRNAHTSFFFIANRITEQ